MQKSNKSNEPVQEGAPALTDKISLWLGQNFHSKKNLKQFGILLLITALLVAFITYQRQSSGSKVTSQNKKLGQAYVYLSHNNLDSAEAFLQNFVSGSHKDIVVAKAYLLLGKVQFLQAKYQESLASYQRVKGAHSKHDIIKSGALHGAAACNIQLKEYQQAIALLEEFLSLYRKRPALPKARNAPDAPKDISPAVPDVLWKLALCYKQVNNTEKARDACQKLIDVYGSTEEAQKAMRFLLTL